MQNSITALVGIHGALSAKLPDDERYAHVNVSLDAKSYGNDLTFVVWEDDEAIQAAQDLSNAIYAASVRAATNLARRRDEARKAELQRESAALSNEGGYPNADLFSIPAEDA